MPEQFSDIFYLDEKVHADDRGTFIKFFDQEIVGQHSFSIEQTNFVETPSRGVFRGLHYQVGDKAEAKIFRVLGGGIELVFFDTRPDSPSCGKSGFLTLSHPREAVYIPRGYATGYLTLEANIRVLYMADAPYCPEAERGISIRDVAVQGQLSVAEPVLSEKDANWPPWTGAT